MRTTLFTAVGVALLALATTQAASAADGQHARRAEQFRNANNAVVVAPPRAVVVQPDASQYYSGGYSAPAGR